MSKTLTKRDFEYLNNLVSKYQVEGAISVYTYLLNQQGADYAGWARGVASGDAITGQAALSFMQNIAKKPPKTEVDANTGKLEQEFGLGREISSEERDEIRVSMAKAYLKKLEERISKGEGVYMNFETMREFHEEAFKEHKLEIKYWTLETPMKLVGKYFGTDMGIAPEVVQEEWWQELSGTKGTGLNSMFASMKLSYFVKDVANGGFYIDNNGKYTSRLVASHQDAVKDELTNNIYYDENGDDPLSDDGAGLISRHRGGACVPGQVAADKV